MIFQPQFSNAATPLAEYPRPQFKRDSYFSLNGEWQYAICKEKNNQINWKNRKFSYIIGEKYS